MLSLKDLGYLVALKDLGHFGKAAQSCHVSQPTLSGKLKNYKQRLGCSFLRAALRRSSLPM